MPIQKRSAVRIWRPVDALPQIDTGEGSLREDDGRDEDRVGLGEMGLDGDDQRAREYRRRDQGGSGSKSASVAQ